MPDSPASTRIVADHPFYLWDDTDEHTRMLCGLGCGRDPEEHISLADWTAAERVRAAAPALLAAGRRLAERLELAPPDCCGMWDEGHTEDCPLASLRAAIAAAEGREPQP